MRRAFKALTPVITPVSRPTPALATDCIGYRGTYGSCSDGVWPFTRSSGPNERAAALGHGWNLDTIIVRSVLVPASMRLLGDANWYLPSWLHWLPEFRTEG